MQHIYKIFLLIILLSSFEKGYSQFSKLPEEVFSDSKKYLVAIGTVVDDSITNNGKRVIRKRFVVIGSGLITYFKLDTLMIKTIVTAKHVVDFFSEHRLSTIYIKPSSSDTVKNTDYFGISIPITKYLPPYIYNHPQKNVDLACINIPPSLERYFFYEGYKSSSISVFPIRNIGAPMLGDQVWIYGYPDHIQPKNLIAFPYTISTFKPGYVTWKPDVKSTNLDLKHITVIESNATHGNSGGPVFSYNDNIQLVGILVSGAYEEDSVYLNNQTVFDPISKKPLLTLARSGVSIIEKGEYVTELLAFVQSDFLKLYKEGKLK